MVDSSSDKQCAAWALAWEFRVPRGGINAAVRPFRLRPSSLTVRIDRAPAGAAAPHRTACTGAGRRALHPAAGPYPATYHALPASQPFRLGRGSGPIRIPVDLHTPARTRTRCTNHHSASQCTTQRPTLLPGRSSPSTRVYKYRGSSSRPASSKAASSSFLARRSSQCTVGTNADHQQLGNG